MNQTNLPPKITNQKDIKIFKILSQILGGFWCLIGIVCLIRGYFSLALYQFISGIFLFILPYFLKLFMKEKNKKIFAFIINFFIIGSGFVILMGKKGLKLTLIYLISFIFIYLTGLAILILMTPFALVRLPSWPSISNISQITIMLIYIICYIHLYKVSKKIFLKA